MNLNQHLHTLPFIPNFCLQIKIPPFFCLSVLKGIVVDIDRRLPIKVDTTVELGKKLCHFSFKERHHKIIFLGPKRSKKKVNPTFFLHLSLQNFAKRSHQIPDIPLDWIYTIRNRLDHSTLKIWKIVELWKVGLILSKSLRSTFLFFTG